MAPTTVNTGGISLPAPPWMDLLHAALGGNCAPDLCLEHLRAWQEERT